MEENKTYEELMNSIDAVLDGEDNLITIMSTLVCLLRQCFSKFYWVGFYLEDKGVLKVGPYQGTLGCLTITPDRGVCGRAYRTRETQIVDDVHADPEHITCDSAALSEIVIPIQRPDGTIYGVLDVDSDKLSTFNSTDKTYLEEIIKRFLQPLL